NRQRGNFAELAFMRKAASLGLSVAKPWGEGERYDVIVRVDSSCWRVQVKSVLAKTPSKPHYRIKTSTGGGAHSRIVLYSSMEIDSLPLTSFPRTLGTFFRQPLLNREESCA